MSETGETARAQATELGFLPSRARSFRNHTSRSLAVRGEVDLLGVFHLRAVGAGADKIRWDGTSAMSILNRDLAVKRKHVLSTEKPYSPEWGSEVGLVLDPACYPKLAHRN